MKSLFIYYLTIPLLLLYSCSNEELVSGKEENQGYENVVSISVVQNIISTTRATTTEGLSPDNTATCNVNAISLYLFKKDASGEFLYEKEEQITSAYTEDTKDGTVMSNGTLLPCQTVTRIFKKKLTLDEGEIYRIIPLGYNKEEIQTLPYTLNLVAGETNYNNMQISIKTSTDKNNPLPAPELFYNDGCQGNDNKIDITSVTAADGITGTLYRAVGGFRMTISNIPTEIKSLRLLTERIGASIPVTGDWPFIRPAAYAYGCYLQTVMPNAAGIAVFDVSLFSCEGSYFYVDAVDVSDYATRYQIKCEDMNSGTVGPTGVVEEYVKDNRFMMYRNFLFRLSGPFENLTTGNIQIDVEWDSDSYWGGSLN